ncbi:MAG: SPOUT family RNA methylase [Armatimonadetes bacterium]|nr:SPOUT family RNA methylase [Armatimonadota bacterium]
MRYIVTTLRGLESVVAEWLKEKLGAKVETFERYSGLLRVDVNADQQAVLDAAYEIDRAVPILAECSADLEAILPTALKVAKEILQPSESFAVRCERRGEHPFTSQQVNEQVGAVIKSELGNPVNLDYPDKVVRVEIIDDWCGIGYDFVRYHKYLGKWDARELLHKVCIVQMPYTGEGAKRMGLDIGRAAQAFEVKQYIVAPAQPVELGEILPFLEGLREGVQSRYSIQKRAYPFPVRETEILVYELFQAVRMKRGQPETVLIHTDPLGTPFPKVRDELLRAVKDAKEVVILAGAREGLPVGLMRACDFVVDLMPKVTFATEHVIPVTLSALANSWVR